MRLPFPIHSHTLVSLGSGYVTQKFSTLGWFWSAYWLQRLHFFSFSRLFVTTGDFFFLFATSKIPSFYFPLSQELFFSHFKIQFCHICLRSRHTSFTLLNSSTLLRSKRNKLVPLFPLPLCKKWILTGGELPLSY